MTHALTAETLSDQASQPLLEVSDLHVKFPTPDGVVHAVRGVSFDLKPSEVLGVVGESGSGKSVTSLAIMGLLPRGAQVTGSVQFRNQELLSLRDKDLSVHRGRDIAMVFQDPMTSLNPVYKVGKQIIEAIKIHHRDISDKQALERAIELLDIVGIPRAKDRINSYPHEFSGGMRQRVVIAIAMANEPAIIIADEPTTALDVTVQAQVLDTLAKAREHTRAAIILITHDLGVVASLADRVMVMYAGRPVEIGDVADIYYRPKMPYTIGLLGSLPRLDAPVDQPLTPITGSPPSLLNIGVGCAFSPRCPMSQAQCKETDPPLIDVGEQHFSACLFADELPITELGSAENPAQ